MNQYHPGKTLSLANMHMKTDFKSDFSMKSDGEVTVSAENDELPEVVDLSDVVHGKFNDSNDHHPHW